MRDTVIFNKDNGEVLHSLLMVGNAASNFYTVRYMLGDRKNWENFSVEELDRACEFLLFEYGNKKDVFVNLVKENEEKWEKSIDDLKDGSDTDYWNKCFDEYASLKSIFCTLDDHELDSVDVAEMIRCIEEEEITDEWGDLTGFFPKLKHYSFEYADELSDKETGLDVVKKYAPAYYSILKGRYNPSDRKSNKDFMKHILDVMKTLIDEKRNS